MFRSHLLCTIALALCAHDARADLLLNEVLYDPAGADEGTEFVELWNPDSIPAPLAGVTVEAGDGSRPGSWSVVYRGVEGETVPARSPLLIAGAVLAGALQNGPDAVRLVRNGAAVLDLLGYGELTAPELYLGEPAPDAPSGASLARNADGAGVGRNSTDWGVDPAPTPGRANHPDIRLEWSATGATLEPEVAWPSDAVTVGAVVRNRGRLTVPGDRWRVEAELGPGSAADAGGDPSGSGFVGAAVGAVAGSRLAPGESLRVSLVFAAPGAGTYRARLRLVDAAGADEGSSAGEGEIGAIGDTLLVLGRSVAGPAIVNEFAFRDAGAGEWVELFFTHDLGDVGDLALADSGSKRFAVDRGAAPRPARAGEYLILAQSPDELRSRYALPEGVIVGLRGGWPALNDAGGGAGATDRVRILTSEGFPADAVPYVSAASRGGSVERLGAELPSSLPGSWGESLDPRGGTPGRPNSLHVPEGGGGRGLLRAGGRVLHRSARGVSPVALRLTEEARGLTVRVWVSDLLGRPRRVLVDGQRFSGEAAFLWDGRDDSGEPVPSGIYIVRAETEASDGGAGRASSLALTVAAGGTR